MGLDPVEKFLATLRSGVPNAEVVFTEGNCFQLFLILRSVFPQAVPYYSQIRGHVYTEIDGCLYDIEGKAYRTSGEKWGIGPLMVMTDEPRIFKSAFRWRWTNNPQHNPCNTN